MCLFPAHSVIPHVHVGSTSVLGTRETPQRRVPFPQIILLGQRPTTSSSPDMIVAVRAAPRVQRRVPSSESEGSNGVVEQQSSPVGDNDNLLSQPQHLLPSTRETTAGKNPRSHRKSKQHAGPHKGGILGNSQHGTRREGDAHAHGRQHAHTAADGSMSYTDCSQTALGSDSQVLKHLCRKRRFQASYWKSVGSWSSIGKESFRVFGFWAVGFLGSWVLRGGRC